MKKNRKRQKGFSLVELIVVIAVMAVLVVVLAPAYLRYVGKAKLQRDISAIGEVIQAIGISGAEAKISKEIPMRGENDEHIVVAISGNEGEISVADSTMVSVVSESTTELEKAIVEIIGEKVQFKNEVIKELGIKIGVCRDKNYGIGTWIFIEDYYQRDSEVASELKKHFATQIEWAFLRDMFVTVGQQVYETSNNAIDNNPDIKYTKPGCTTEYTGIDAITQAQWDVASNDAAVNTLQLASNEIAAVLEAKYQENKTYFDENFRDGEDYETYKREVYAYLFDEMKNEAEEQKNYEFNSAVEAIRAGMKYGVEADWMPPAL